jgi:hypothetical protein
MKIDSTGRLRPAAGGAKGKSGKVGKGGGFSDHLSPNAESVSSVGSTISTQSVDALLAIQGVPDATDGRANARARKWGNEALDQLEHIRTDLLLGAIPKGRLMNLARMVSERREHATDPYLNSLLDDIELRVRVEIAKYEPRKVPSGA